MVSESPHNQFDEPQGPIRATSQHQGAVAKPVRTVAQLVLLAMFVVTIFMHVWFFASVLLIGVLFLVGITPATLRQYVAQFPRLKLHWPEGHESDPNDTS